MTTGWARLIGKTKRHYVVDGKTLCGYVAGDLYTAFDPYNQDDESRDNCFDCVYHKARLAKSKFPKEVLAMREALSGLLCAVPDRSAGKALAKEAMAAFDKLNEQTPLAKLLQASIDKVKQEQT